MRWAQQQRIAFIGERILANNTVNRGDLVEKFGISIAQASVDLRYFNETHPGAMRYDAHNKAYLPNRLTVGGDPPMPMMPKPTQPPPKPEPWPPERRARMKARIDKAAKAAKNMLGAHTVVIIATFEDGEFLHMQDGGTSPMPLMELYARIQSSHQVMDVSDGKDVVIQ